MDSLSALLFLVKKHDLLPTGIPAVVADQVSQGEHRVEMMLCPAHAGAFQPSLHHALVATLNAAGTDGITTTAEVRIVQHGQPRL
jgi:hypothetical protein